MHLLYVSTTMRTQLLAFWADLIEKYELKENKKGALPPLDPHRRAASGPQWGLPLRHHRSHDTFLNFEQS